MLGKAAEHAMLSHYDGLAHQHLKLGRRLFPRFDSTNFTAEKKRSHSFDVGGMYATFTK
ncbi:hypothetical protein F441_11811 [Phytophthora nicotianae CJ01A1]|uniref:Uncharacterized protein n=1 Tax=Phytophthora nicotianae CJ01A1 TaxID=1317063 RepID=W2WQR6_PHYNI|nr:hypothetical protein F441_11811 [Phytophthora nicotianae CJ01A1]